MADIQGKTVAFLATDGVEQVELTDPWKAVEEAGGTPELISLEDGVAQGFNHLDKADTFSVDHTAQEADAAEYDALVLPGGVANPDALRTDPDAVAFVRAFFDQGKPVAAICHAPWTLIDAEVVRWPSWTPSAISSTSLAQNAGRSSGLREVTSPPSTWTSSSTQDAPALRRSVLSDGHEVSVRPPTTPASISVQGPWQIAATGLPCSKKARVKATASSSPRRTSGFATPPGSTSAS